jgi:hypothetical protein
MHEEAADSNIILEQVNIATFLSYIFQKNSSFSLASRFFWIFLEKLFFILTLILFPLLKHLCSRTQFDLLAGFLDEVQTPEAQIQNDMAQQCQGPTTAQPSLDVHTFQVSISAKGWFCSLCSCSYKIKIKNESPSLYV